MLYTTETTQRFLVRSGVKQTDILVLFPDQIWVKYRIRMPCTVKILTITSQVPRCNTLIFFVPIIYSQQNITLTNSPGYLAKSL